MDLSKIFLKWGIPRDIIDIIHDYVRFSRYPYDVTCVQVLRAKQNRIMIEKPFTNNIIVYCDIPCNYRGWIYDYSWLDIQTYESGPLCSSNYIEVISKKAYLSYQDGLKIEGAHLNGITDFDFECIVFDYLFITRKNDARVEVTATNELFYLPTAGVFAVRYTSDHPDYKIPDNMLATGSTTLIKRFVPMEPDAIKFTMDFPCSISNLYEKFAIVSDLNGPIYVVLRDNTRYCVDDAIRFTTDSFLFRNDNRFYFRRVGCLAVEIHWLKDISLSSIRVHKNRIAYQMKDLRCIYFGDIEWK